MNGSIHGPERLRDQGVGAQQEESAHRAIRALLCDDAVREQVDLVALYRRGPEEAPGHGWYEVWAVRGLLRFRRRIDAAGRLAFELLEVVGENPLARDDPHALRSVEEEKAAARASGFDAEDPARRFIAPAHQSHPFGCERIAQLFDSPHAPDLVVSPTDWCFGTQAGNHGALHVRQSRAPLWLAGPRIRPGRYERAARAVDIAPTALAALGFPYVDGRDATGRSASERGVPPDVLLRRQDGEVLTDVLDPAEPPARHLYVFLLDGLHASELEDRLARDPHALPGLRRLQQRAAVLASGSIVNFPSITWPSHTTIGTGSWCGHHDVVNPSYYLREKREMVSPQGQQVHTEGFSSPDVESLHEAFRRVRGDDGCLTAAIYAPFGRSAHHAVLEGRNLGHLPSLRTLTRELACDEDPRWRADGQDDVARESNLDTRGLAQVFDLFQRDDVRSPDFVFHELILTDGVGHEYGPHSEGMRAALDESDRRIARVLDLLEAQGRLADTLFVVTADHGMAPQDTSLRANPARHVKIAGIASQVAEPMIWLLDLAVTAERAGDGRTGRIRVEEHDALPDGERPPVEGARVEVVAHHAGTTPELVARGTTGPGGYFGFATPAEVASRDLVVHVHADGFNERHLRMDGENLALDLRALLYGRG